MTRLTPIASLVLAAIGCSVGEGRPVAGAEDVAFDLVAAFPRAELHRQSGQIDFASSEAEPMLLEGWASRPTGNGRRWALGSRSTLRFFVAEPRPLTLIARGRAFGPDPGLSGVTLAVNGDVGAHGGGQMRPPISPGSRDLRWEIPAALLRAGENRLSFSYAKHRAPEVGERDLRPLAFAWESLTFEGLQASATPRVGEGATPQIFLPGRSQIDYYLRVGPEPVFAVDGIASVGLESGKLVVEVEREGGAPGHAFVATLEGGSAHLVRVRIPPAESRAGTRGSASPRAGSPGSGLIRLSLRAIGADRGAPSGGAGLRLLAPRIHSGPATPESPPTHATAPLAPPTFDERPNVVIYLADTVRADHLGAYSHARVSSPGIDAWARSAAVFEDFRANSSWTRPSTASILTGLGPFSHRVISPEDVLPGDAQTLAELLSAAGYATAAWVANINVSQTFGFDQGFDRFELLPEDLTSPVLFAGADRLTDAALDWIRKHLRDREDRPFFVYLHAMDPHGPYTPPSSLPIESAAPGGEPILGTLASLRELGRLAKPVDGETISALEELYDAEIGFLDLQFTRLLEGLAYEGLLDDSLVVFLSDHGEEFFDHAWWEHGKTLYEEQLRVPLIVGFPGGWAAGTRLAHQVEQIDVLPTVLDAVGLPIPPGVEGRSAIRWMTTGVRVPARASLALTDRGGRRVASVVLGADKLIEYGSYAHPRGERPVAQLYDLARDQSESRNTIESRPVLAGYLRSLLREAGAAPAALPSERSDLSTSLEERLRALGYVE